MKLVIQFNNRNLAEASALASYCSNALGWKRIDLGLGEFGFIVGIADLSDGRFNELLSEAMQALCTIEYRPSFGEV